MSRLLCLSDTQLGAHGRLADQEQVLDRIVEVAVDRQVDGVLHAGDVFEGPIITPEQLQAFAGFVAELRAAGIPLLAVSGNGRHDLAVRETNALAIFGHVPGVTVENRPDVHLLAGCAVFTLPWVHPGRWVAARNGGDRDQVNAEVAQLLVEVCERGLADCRRVAGEAPALLLGHWHVDQATSANGSATALFREPLLPLAELERLGFDAIVLGHNHRGQILCEQPPIFHVGSPMAHDFGEAGFDHGIWILDLGASTTEFLQVESRPLVTFELAPESWLSDGEPLEIQVADGALVRVRYTATADQQRQLDPAALRRLFLDAGAAEVKIVPEIIRADRARISGLDEQASELDALDRWLDANEIPDETAAAARERASSYLEGSS